MQELLLDKSVRLTDRNARASAFDEYAVLHELKHLLPAQAPLKDFVHHNTLHAFQHMRFYDALRQASGMFGYKVSLSLKEYRELYSSGRIREDVLQQAIIRRKGAAQAKVWQEKLLHGHYQAAAKPRIGALRAIWRKQYHIDLDALVHPKLFRILCSYLDQGIAAWGFPVWHKGFLASVKELERNSFTTFFKTNRAKNLLLNSTCELEDLLHRLVGDEKLYKQYLFDQQFAHQGWSGMVSAIEDQPQSLLDQRKISLHDLMLFELLLEIDALDAQFGPDWEPLTSHLKTPMPDLFAEVTETELHEITAIWQEAFEWSYYDQVLTGIQLESKTRRLIPVKSFQAMFCIDDRECSLRRYLEQFDPTCETFGTPGFFGVEFYFKPEHGKFSTKVCPGPVQPKFLVKEVGTKETRQKEVHFTKLTHSLLPGFLITQTLGFWSAFKLSLNVFRPSISPATASSFRHMDKVSQLTIENRHPQDREEGLQVGFTVEEMAQRVENLLRSIGMIKDFAPIIYAVGHGASSVNNPHYAAYDCGACSGRPGSVNARVISYMGNHPKVREILHAKGLSIPDETQFIGALHDTTRDEIAFYDEELLSPENLKRHKANVLIFNEALDYNAKERSRRFESIDTRLSAKKVHEKILRRSVSLFEPRPELNHATNSLCLVGRRELSKGLFLDRRAFLNSYDYRTDPYGHYLLGIMKAATPVCGGINLEYYFSRVDNQKLGAGTKLPHNVMGLFGVANGIDGDLRPGLPSQMVEVHDPVRMLFVVEHLPEVVLRTLQQSPETFDWFRNEWVHLVVLNPETQELLVLREGQFESYTPLQTSLQTVPDVRALVESDQENIPVYLISQQ